MTPPRVRPDYEADERTQLVAWLEMQRAIIHWKCEGLSEDDAHRAVLPASPLMTMAGLVSHLRWVEHMWFEVMLLNHPSSDNPAFSDDPEDLEMMVDDVPLAKLLADYEQQVKTSNEITAAHNLDDVGKNRDHRAGNASLRWILFHMIEETARHAGHADAIRELLDGEVGYY